MDTISDVARSRGRCFQVALLIGALVGSSTQSMCTTKRFRATEGYALLGQIIATHHVLISAECLDLCTSQPKCVSYNYQYTGPAPHRCELNGATANMCPGSLQPRTGFKFYEDKNARGNVPCFLEGSFEFFQNVSTVGAHASEWFEINGRLFLAFANFYNGTKRTLKSFIYKLHNHTLELHQEIELTGAFTLEYFQISGSHFLAFGCKKDGGNFNRMSKIYVWSGSEFTFFQQIPTSGASDVCFLDDGSLNKFLFVANYFNNFSYSINSTAYRWAGGQFVHYQGLPTNGAKGCKAFMLNGEVYVLFANWMGNDKAYSTYSFLYKLSGNRFTLFQSFSTNRASGVEAFTIDEEHFLAINNKRNQTTQELACAIYRWNGSMFQHFQSIPTSYPLRVEASQVKGRTLLGLTSFHDSPRSAIHLYIGMEFRKIQDINIRRVAELAFVQHGDEYYLAATKYRDESNYYVNSTIYKWKHKG